MRKPYSFSLPKPVLLILLGFLLLKSNPVKAQCYEDYSLYQVYPYGPLCSASYITVRAEYYPSDPYFYYGEFRWYTSETDPNPVRTDYIDTYTTTSDYSFYASATGPAMWVSFYNYTTNCESERMPYYVYISSYPPLYMDYARECGDNVGRIQVSSNTTGITYQLYHLQQIYDPYYGYVDDYQLIAANTDGYFEIPYFDPIDQDKYFVKMYQPYGCSYPYYYQLFFDIASPTPPSVSGNTTVCQGIGGTLTASGSTYDYKWYDGNGNPVVDGYQLSIPNSTPPGYYTYQVSSISYGGCVSNPATVNVIVNPNPVDGSISASATTICLGQSVTITSTGGVGTPHYWCSNDGGVSWNVFMDSYVGQYSFQHTPTSVGTYRYHLRNRTDCGFCWDIAAGCTVFPLVEVTVVAPPNVTITTTTPNFGQGETTLTASIGTGTYQWFFNGVEIPGATGVSFKPGRSGNYVVKVQSNTGCVSTSAPVSVNISNNNNYLITNNIKVPGITSTSQINALGASALQQSIAYLDGLGRTVQQVNTQSSPGNHDIVSFSVLDNADRETKQYLPYTAGNDGSFKTDALTAQPAFYQNLKSDNLAYSEIKFENSPLNRVLEQGALGAAWQLGSGHTKTIAYKKNIANEVRAWNFDVTTKTATGTTFYSANELTVTEMTDEQGHKTVEYKNKGGQLVCKKEQKVQNDDNSYLFTYYVYDDFGNYRFVISPEGVNNLAAISYTFTYNDLFCQRWVYASDYDNQMRLTEKSTPGGGITYMVYDPVDRVILTQDANMRPNNQWLFSKYDIMGRAIMSGITVQNYASQAAMQSAVDSYYSSAGISYYESRSNSNFSGQHGYTNQAFPVLPVPNNNNGQPYKINYYDDYDFDYNGTESETSKGEPVYVNMGSNFPSVPSLAKGKLTGERTLVPATGTWLTSASYYDEEGKIVQSQSENYHTSSIVPAGKGRSEEVVATQYDFSGAVVRTEQRHCNIIADNTYNFSVQERQVYDNAGRVIENYSRVAATPEKKIATYVYNEIGEHQDKSLSPDFNGGQSLATLHYDYNIRGWLTSVNKNYLQSAGNPITPASWFGMELAYNNTTSVVSGTGYNAAQYNGSITGTLWKTRGSGGANRKFDYTYDNLNRLTAADFNQQFSNGWGKTDPSGAPFTIDFSMGGKGNSNQFMQYDDNGNILSLWQKGLKINASPKMDDLDYGYSSGNQLGYVTDGANDPNTKLGDFHDGTNSGNDYTYDANGNLIEDKNKGISSITYNQLNLPLLITITGKGTIQYVYDAEGNKLEKILTDTRVTPNKITTWRYIDGFIYKDEQLQHLAHDEGRVRWTAPPVAGVGGSFVYDYYITDNLGNIRTILTEEVDTKAYTAASMEDVVDKNNLNDPANYIPYYTNTDYTASPGLRFPIANVPGYPVDNYTPVNDYVAKVNGSTNKAGPGILLKVMAGDQFNLRVSSWYKTNGVSPGVPVNPLADIVVALAGGVESVGKFTASELQSNGVLSPQLTNFFGDHPNDPAKPKAYVNWVLLDEQFRYVSSSSGAEQVGANEEFKVHTFSGLPVTVSGYLYVYVSNETPNIDVFFDNLQVTHIKGPLLEESHYYPLGLEMAGISSHAYKAPSILNKFKYQGKEFEDAFDLDMYEFDARQYDPQIGRWHSPDPSDQFASPYLAMGNNWPNGTDPDGKYFLIDDLIAGAVGGLINLGSMLVTGQVHSVGQAFGYFGVGFVAGVSVEYTGGLAAGAIIGAGNALVGGASIKEALVQGAIGAITSGIGSAIGGQLAPALSKLTNGLGTAVSSAVTQIGTSTIVGGILGAGVAAFTGGDIGEGFRTGLLTGFAGGAVSVGVNAAADALRSARSKPPPPESNLEPVDPKDIPLAKTAPEEPNVGNAVKPPPATQNPPPSNNNNYTKNNYRKNLVKKTGINPKDAQAHHDIPQKYRKLMAKYGINVDDPKYLRWWQKSTHQKYARQFNDHWKSFLQEVPNPTRIQVHRWVIAMRSRFPTGITGY